MNYFRIIIAVTLQQMVGFFWYSPMLFANAWMAGVGKVQTDLHPTPDLFMKAALCSFLLTMVMAKMIQWASVKNFFDGLVVASILWAGFVFPVTFTHYIFLGYHLDVILIDSGYTLINMLLAGAILGHWRKK